jgi:hypothetical protein
MAEWVVHLEGELIDLARLAKWSLPDVTVSQEDGQYVLRSPKFVGPDQQVHAEATRLVGAFSDLVHLADGSSSPIRVGAVAHVMDGKRQVFLSVTTSASIRAAMEKTVIRPDGTQQVPAPEPDWGSLASLVLAEADAQRALRFLAQGDWVALYKALEVVEHSVGGERQLEAKGWGAPSDVKRFTRTANNMQALGDEARHANPKFVPPRAPMALDEARHLIRTVLTRWLQETVRPEGP